MYDLFKYNIACQEIIVAMPPRKRPQVIEYTPSTPLLSTMGTITSHHTHYEPRRRPVKSTVTVEGPVVADVPLDTLTSPLTSLAPLVAFLDDDGIEQVECEGQELEVHGLSMHTEAGLSVEGDHKRRRTQAVGNIILTRETELTL